MVPVGRSVPTRCTSIVHVAWLNMRDYAIDVIVGPIGTYEDQLFGCKASHACYIAVKDQQCSVRLAHFAALLPEL